MNYNSIKNVLIGLSIVSCIQAQKKQNIIYIMSNDYATNAIGVYESRLPVLNPTPNIDKLAKEGMVFKNCFVTNSIWTPSRATILTGQYSQTNHMLDFSRELDTTQLYLPQEIKKQGYETAMIGKWHVGCEPTAFDFYSVLPGQGKYFDPTFNEKGQGIWPNNIVKSEGHSSDVITGKAIHWLSNRKDKSKPFFLMYHFKDYKLIFFYERHWDLYEEGKQSRTWLKPGESFLVRPTPVSWELYDLKKDPFEIKNVYSDPAYSKIISELKAEMKRKRELYNETDKIYPHIQNIVDENWDK